MAAALDGNLAESWAVWANRARIFTPVWWEATAEIRGLRCYIVITMKRTQIAIRRMGNSQGIVIPKPLIAQIGLEGHAEVTIERGALVLRRPAKPNRAGWAATAQKLAQKEDDALMGEFGNQDDAELGW
jgi:antitoxin MazE